MPGGPKSSTITITRTENISSYDDLVNKLESCDLGDFFSSECYDLLEKITEFPITVRQKPHLYLDRFQREACRVYISRLVSDEDVVFSPTLMSSQIIYPIFVLNIFLTPMTFIPFGSTSSSIFPTFMIENGIAH